MIVHPNRPLTSLQGGDWIPRVLRVHHLLGLLVFFVGNPYSRKKIQETDRPSSLCLPVFAALATQPECHDVMVMLLIGRRMTSEMGPMDTEILAD